MPDPVNPADPPPGARGRAGAEEVPGDGSEAMREMIRAVAAWYSQQILAERRATVPDQARLEDLVARYRACMADQHALEDEDPQEAARLADRYTALYRELTRQ